MSEEFGNNFVVLCDEEGVEQEFEHLDTLEYEGVTYMAFIPAAMSLEEEAELVIIVVHAVGVDILTGGGSDFHQEGDAKHGMPGCTSGDWRQAEHDLAALTALL